MTLKAAQTSHTRARITPGENIASDSAGPIFTEANHMNSAIARMEEEVKIIWVATMAKHSISSAELIRTTGGDRVYDLKMENGRSSKQKGSRYSRPSN